MANTNKIQELRTALNTEFLERDELVDGMCAALISGEPCLLLGLPGTAKSMIARAICTTLGGDFYQWCLGKLTTPEELFGSLSLKGLENDRYLRNTKGKLPECHIAFLDEVFKGSSAILNTLLTVMNERVFFNDGQAMKVPMVTMFGASNELPQAEELSAMYDRFVLRYEVGYLQEDANVEKLFTGLKPAKYPSITLKELAQYRLEADQVNVPSDIIQSLISLRRNVNNEGMLVSDRKWRQAIGVLKAFAFINGNTDVTDDDMVILNDIIWSNPEERASARKLVAKVSNPINEKIMQHLDAVVQLYADINQGKTKDADVFESVAKMSNAKKSLEKLVDKKRPNKRLEAALAKVAALHLSVCQKQLGIAKDDVKV